MATGLRTDPFRQYNFLVEFDGIARAGFKECSGLDTSQKIIEYREGGDILAAKKLPGLVSYSNIILRWGMTNDKDFWSWRKKAQDGTVERKNGSIILLDDAGTEKGRWNLSEAWPIRWMGPHFDATGNGVAIETLEITHEGISSSNPTAA